MIFLHNIRTVAQYEAKTLRRSWFFRLFSIGAIGIFTFMNIGLFSPVGDEPWDLVSIPSSIPLINLYLLNIAQAIVVIFLAADFLKRDKKLDTNEVLYTRSMSNLEYVTGKTWGILRLFLGLDILILAIGLIMNIISKSMSIDLMSYLSYLLILSVPTIVFSLGLAFMLMSLIRNQAITFLILLGCAALNIFWLWFRAGSIFDYMAFGVPVFKSGIVGFDNLGFIINQRLIYFFLGLALVMGTVLLFNRLPQSKSHRILTIILLLLFATGSVICSFNTYYLYTSNINEKEKVIETNRQFEDKVFTSITDASIEFIHRGNTFEATARLKIINSRNQEIDNYIFSLNPSLSITEITSGGKELSFKRTHNIIEIYPGKVLAGGQKDTLEFRYSGAISESFCYPDYNDNIKENPYRIAMVNVNKRQAFLTNDYVLLTPETNWYPVAGLQYYPTNPARIKIDFTNFRLRVKTINNLTAVSQGRLVMDDGYYTFKPEIPLTGLTLAIGNYKSDTLKIDSTEYINYYFPGNDYYKKDLAELKDTLPLLISGIMRELETNFSVKYPFSTLSLIEVPVQFYSYPKKNTQTRAEVQPSIVLLPEKLSSLRNAGFNKQFKRQKKNMARQNQIITDKELQVRLFNNFIRNTFISGENFRFVNGIPLNEPTRYRLGPSFYFFRNNFFSSEYPVVNSVFESHLQKMTNQMRVGIQAMPGALSDNDKANLILKKSSFSELLAKNPGPDTLKSVLSVKGDYFFNLLRAKAGIEEFNTWFVKYLDNNKFICVDILKLNTDIKEKFGFEFYPYLNDWFNRKEQPGLIFNDLQANEIVINDRVRYQVTFIASNPEPVAGLFNISFRTGGPGGRGRGGQQMMNNNPGGPGGGGFAISMQGRGMDASDIAKIIYIGPKEAKKIGIVLDAQPRAMMINALFAKNIPGEIILPVGNILKNKGITKEFTGDEILTSLPLFIEKTEKVVDNEDPGFKNSNLVIQSPLKKILGINRRQGENYRPISIWNVPEYWRSVVLSSYYGKYVLSCVYTRAGSGDRMVTWTTPIDEPGYYDIYTYIGKMADRMMIRSAGQGGQRGQPERGGPGMQAGGPQGENLYKDMHYKIYHDAGVEDITLDYENAEGGWNNLGRFYISTDSAKVVLTNLSAGKIVIGDAVKWQLQK
jgi:hypothetical protein